MTPLGCNIMVVVYDCGYKTLKVSFYLNETPIEMVLDDGQTRKTCTKCPIEDIKNLIDGFKTNEPLHSTSNIASNLQKKEEKEKKLKAQKLEKDNNKIRLDEEKERERQNNALNDREDYQDKN